MGQVREHIPDSAEALTQWMGRKLVNHQPMKIRVGAKAAARQKVGLRAENRAEVVYDPGDGRLFVLSCREITEDAEADAIGKLEPVGR